MTALVLALTGVNVVLFLASRVADARAAARSDEVLRALRASDATRSQVLNETRAIIEAVRVHVAGVRR